MTRRRLVIVALAAAAIGLGFAAWHLLARPAGTAPEPPGAEAASEPSTRNAAAEPPPPAPLPPSSSEPAPALPAGLAAVDLESVRRALPDNLYWELAAPSDDPRVLDEREREKAFRNEQWGKILSGTGSEEEILDYYDHRMRVSTDYVQFSEHLLEHYAGELTDQDLELLHLARRMHLARLEEIPRRLQEARERKRQQDEARAAWLADEEAFEADAASPDDDSESRSE